MRRRHLLALAASLATGGCAGSGTGPATGSTVTPVPVPESETGRTRSGSATRSVDVTAAAVQPGVVAPSSPDSIGLLGDAGQYLVVTVEGDAPEKAAVDFRFDDTSHSPGEFEQGLYRDDEWGVRYGADGGPLVFALPETGDGTDAELVWPEGRWLPPASVVERLEDPLPPFSVSLDGPETATAGEDPQLTVSVTNEGEGVGRYVLALNRIGPRIAYTPVARISGELSAGESERRTIEAVAPEGDRSTRYRLAAAGRRDELIHVIQSSE